jgi:hypothetical protein
LTVLCSAAAASAFEAKLIHSCAVSSMSDLSLRLKALRARLIAISA